MLPSRFQIGHGDAVRWLRTLPDGLSRELRREWATLRELGKAELTLRAIEQMVALEKLRGSRGA